MEEGTEFAAPGLELFMLFTSETPLRRSSDGTEASVADEVPAELREGAESEDAEPVVLLRARELLMDEFDVEGVANGADTDTFFGFGS